MFNCYIFDQDGTLYPRSHKLTDAIRRANKQWLMESLGLNKHQVEELYRRLPEIYPNPFDGFTSLGLSIRSYQKVFDQIDPAKYLENDKRLINLLSRIRTPKYVVTVASKRFSLGVIEALGIGHLITELIPLSDFLPQHSKSAPYRYVQRSLGMNPTEICIVGDNFEVDIVPALENGFSTVFIGSEIDGYNGRYISDIYELLDPDPKIKEKFF